MWDKNTFQILLCFKAIDKIFNSSDFYMNYVQQEMSVKDLVLSQDDEKPSPMYPFIELIHAFTPLSEYFDLWK